MVAENGTHHPSHDGNVRKPRQPAMPAGADEKNNDSP